MHDPTDIVARLRAQARVHRTPSGTGEMVWHCWTSRAPGRPRPVVLLHGGSGSWTHWIRNIDQLRQHYEVWAGDIPGLGDSAMPHEPATPTSCAEVVAAGLATLIAAERRPHLVGFSFGAHVGTIVATLRGDAFASFTIAGSAALGLQRKPLKYPKERSTMTVDERDAVHRGTLEILMFHDPSRIDDLAIRVQAENVRRSRFRSRPFALTDDIRRALPRVEAPVNAIWGAHDVIPQPNVDACYAIIREHHPELLVRTVDDAGHWVMYEQPAAFNAALIELLGMRD